MSVCSLFIYHILRCMSLFLFLRNFHRCDLCSSATYWAENTVLRDILGFSLKTDQNCWWQSFALPKKTIGVALIAAEEPTAFGITKHPITFVKQNFRWITNHSISFVKHYFWWLKINIWFQLETCCASFKTTKSAIRNNDNEFTQRQLHYIFNALFMLARYNWA